MLGAVLIMVDASGVVSPSLVRIIKRSGYDSLAVENGEQDLRQYCDHPDVAALFLNLNTLVIGGMEFLEALRSYFADVGRLPL